MGERNKKKLEQELGLGQDELKTISKKDLKEIIREREIQKFGKIICKRKKP